MDDSTDDGSHRIALQLIGEITQCPAVAEVWAGRSHACSRIVGTQPADPSTFQVPEPWAGHLDFARILIVSSNPSISEHEPYPVWSDDTERRTRFFDERFGEGHDQVRDGVRHPLTTPTPEGSWHSKPVAFWRDCKANVEFLLGHPVEAGLDYVMTEVVHCKSRQEQGVRSAVTHCMDRWFDRVLEVSPAPVVILLGAVAVKAVEEHSGSAFPLWQVTEAELGGRDRLVLAAVHPNFHGPRKWEELLAPDTVSRLRCVVDDYYDPVHEQEPDVAFSGSLPSPPQGSTHATGPTDDRMHVVTIHPAVSRLVDQVTAHAAGEAALDIHGDRAVMTTRDRVFLTATADAVTLRLPRSDAERHHAHHGGTLREAPGEPGTRELTIETTALAEPGMADRLYVLALRAFHHATDESSEDEERALTTTHVVEALQEEARFSTGYHADMLEYWTRRRETLWTLFGLPEPSTLAHDTAYAVLESLIESLRVDANPLASFLEVPRRVGEVLARHGDNFQAAEDQRQKAGTAALLDLLELLSPGISTRTVPAAELGRHGLASRPPRDEIDLLIDYDF